MRVWRNRRLIQLNKRHDLNRHILLAYHLYRVAQGAAESIEMNFHEVSVLQFDPLPEAQRMRAQKMDVHISRPAMEFKFEMVMLQVAQAVRHFLFAARDRLRPELLAAAR